MMHFKVKVCGITRPMDAVHAAKLGADMVGMIFYRGSPRFVTIKTASNIASSLPPTVMRVGVFVDEQVSRILLIGERLKLDYIQLHGKEPLRDITILKKAGFKVIRAFHVRKRSDYEYVYKSRADLVLLDNATSEHPGGTGRSFNWSIKPPKPIQNVILAGGVTGDNVVKGVKTFHPLVVDVNSGVEKSPGIKSQNKLKHFFNTCNALRYET